MYKIGVDIGGTSVKLGVVDGDCRIVESMKIPTGRDSTSDGIMIGIINACRELKDKYPVVSVGIGSAGRIDPVAGYVIRADHLPFRNEPVAGRIEEALGIPVCIDNDANCALIGEHAAGACKDADDALILTIGTGVGGAIMIGGKIYRGHNYRAAEFGHFVIDMTGKSCSCGLRGCFEQYASATALIDMTKSYAELFPASMLAVEAEAGVDGSTAFRAAKTGCAVAKDLLKKYGRTLAAGINSFINIFQPEVIVLSGGVAVQGEYLLRFIEPGLLPGAAVRTTLLEGTGGLIGAALLTRDEILSGKRA